jgi:HPt (histidine-containing phosphotransfer) domain-containing protein
MKVNLNYLTTQTGGNKEVMIEMIGIFGEQLIEFQGGLTKYFEERNWLKLSKIAHKAKSSVSIMGMEKTAALLKELELLASEEKEIDRYETILNTIFDDFNRAKQDLEKEIVKFLS